VAQASTPGPLGDTGRPGLPWFVSAPRVDMRMAPADTSGRARFALVAMRPELSRASFQVTRVDRFGDGDRIVRFEQTHLQLPVLGGVAVVVLDRNGNVKTLSDQFAGDLPSSVSASISRDAAVAAIAGRTVLPVSASDAYLAIADTREGARLVYVVVPPQLAGIPTAPWFTVDARTGEIITQREGIVFANVNMYPTNPTASQLASLPLPMAATVQGTSGKFLLENEFIKSMNCVDKGDVKSLNIGIQITAHICSLAQDAESDANGDFNYTPVDSLPTEPATKDAPSRSDKFSEVSMYYHAARAYQFFRDLQGVADAQVVADKPFRTISNLMIPAGLASFDLAKIADPSLPLEPFSNAFFSPSGAGGQSDIFETLYGFKGGSMWFGQGAQRDYSYDGDVIYHEFTHAVVNQTLRLGGPIVDAYGLFDSEGAMNEGLADFFASAIAGDGNMGEYASSDMSPGKTAIRVLDNSDSCPGNLVGEVHYDSTLFSGGLWKTRQALTSAEDKKKFDAAVYKAMRSTSAKGNLGYGDFVNLVIEVLKTDLPTSAPALETEMTTRGVLPVCARVFDAKNGPINPPSASGFGALGFIAYGTSNLGSKAKLAPGSIQAKVDLDRSTKVTVAFNTRSEAAPGGGVFGAPSTPFAPVLFVKYNEPVQWTTKGTLSNNADQTFDGAALTTTGTKSSVEFEVPEGTSAVYVQVGNSGQSDGRVSNLTIMTVPPQGETPAVDDPGVTTTTTGGCACATATATPATRGPVTTRWLMLVGLGGVLAAMLRRKRVKLNH
jgi:hypothetical protein